MITSSADSNGPREVPKRIVTTPALVASHDVVRTPPAPHIPGAPFPAKSLADCVRPSPSRINFHVKPVDGFSSRSKTRVSPTVNVCRAVPGGPAGILTMDILTIFWRGKVYFTQRIVVCMNLKNVLKTALALKNVLKNNYNVVCVVGLSLTRPIHPPWTNRTPACCFPRDKAASKKNLEKKENRKNKVSLTKHPLP